MKLIGQFCAECEHMGAHCTSREYFNNRGQRLVKEIVKMYHTFNFRWIFHLHAYDANNAFLLHTINTPNYANDVHTISILTCVAFAAKTGLRQSPSYRHYHHHTHPSPHFLPVRPSVVIAVPRRKLMLLTGNAHGAGRRFLWDSAVGHCGHVRGTAARRPFVDDVVFVLFAGVGILLVMYNDIPDLWWSCGSAQCFAYVIVVPVLGVVAAEAHTELQLATDRRQRQFEWECVVQNVAAARSTDLQMHIW